MSAENQAKPGESIFSLSVFLFVIPAYLYLCSFEYEIGACDYYNIPKDLITPDIATNLAYSASLFGYIYLAYISPHILLALLFGEKANKNPALYPFIRANALSVLALYAMWIIANYQIDWLKTGLLALVFILFMNFLAYTQYVHIKEKLKVKPYATISQEWNAVVNTPSIILNMPDAFNLRWTLLKDIKLNHLNLIFILFAIAFWSYNIGKRDAYKKTAYEVVNGKNKWILLRKYGDDLILKNYDPKTNLLGDSISVIKVSPYNAITFITKEIGILHPTKEGN